MRMILAELRIPLLRRAPCRNLHIWTRGRRSSFHNIYLLYYWRCAPGCTTGICPSHLSVFEVLLWIRRRKCAVSSPGVVPKLFSKLLSACRIPFGVHTVRRRSLVSDFRLIVGPGRREADCGLPSHYSVPSIRQRLRNLIQWIFWAFSVFLSIASSSSFVSTFSKMRVRACRWGLCS